MAPHFADRLPEENWVIYDENHGKGRLVHPRRTTHGFWLTNPWPEQPERGPGMGPLCSGAGNRRAGLARTCGVCFCDTIAIRERP
ncbi:MAG: DUF4130 domain-containing protein [Enterocloster bolteae]